MTVCLATFRVNMICYAGNVIQYQFAIKPTLACPDHSSTSQLEAGAGGLYRVAWKYAIETSLGCYLLLTTNPTGRPVFQLVNLISMIKNVFLTRVARD